MERTSITKYQWEEAATDDIFVDSEGKEWSVVHNFGKSWDGWHIDLRDPSGKIQDCILHDNCYGRYVNGEDGFPIRVLSNMNVQFIAA